MKFYLIIAVFSSITLVGCSDEPDKTQTCNANCTSSDMNNAVDMSDMVKDSSQTDMSNTADMVDLSDELDMNNMTQQDMINASDMSIEQDMKADMPSSMDMSNTADMSPTTTTLKGTVTGKVNPRFGGDGSLYVVVLTEKPYINNRPNPNTKAIKAAYVPNAFLATDQDSVNYQIDDIPTRPQAYHLIAFLDDNDNVNSNNTPNVAPDSGDMIDAGVVNGMITFPEVVLDDAQTVTQNFIMRTVIP